MADKAAILKALFEPVISAMGLQLWGVEYLGQGKHSLLRVFLDKEGGVDVEDCARASQQISSILDVEDPISGEYTLEVSSPGLDRPLFELQQYRDHVGHVVKIRLRQAFENRRNFEGLLKAVDNDEVIIIQDKEELILPFELIEKANIVAQFEVE